MAKQIWTYETLGQADRPTLENILRTGSPPNLDELEGYIYCGWNHEWIGKLSGEKFKKGFKKRDGKLYGYNERCHQDGMGYRGEWKSRQAPGKPPLALAFFRCTYFKDEPPDPFFEKYKHLSFFTYNLPMNSWYNLPFRVIRDAVVAPNEGDNSLLLSKAYLRVLPFVNLFYCYFLLGHRKKIEYEPW
ncbi:MAG TPA: hypothetical protein VII11_00025 [Bacteroidota bacterium]